MAALRRLDELGAGGRLVLRDAGARQQRDAVFVGRLRVAVVGAEPPPAHRLLVVALEREAVVVDLADQRHRGGVARVGREALLGLAQSGDEIAALIGAERDVAGGIAGLGRQRRIGADVRDGRRFDDRRIEIEALRRAAEREQREGCGDEPHARTPRSRMAALTASALQAPSPNATKSAPAAASGPTCSAVCA